MNKSGGIAAHGALLTLALDAPQIGHDEAVELMIRAHEACPYSRATRGNIDVTLTVGETTAGRAAA